MRRSSRKASLATFRDVWEKLVFRVGRVDGDDTSAMAIVGDDQGRVFS